MLNLLRMTPAHTDSPLRRSEAGMLRENANASNVIINDDDEERRQARRRTLMQSRSSGGDGSSPGSNSTLEDNEALKKCLELYNNNKLSRENAWSLSVIDTLSALLDRHHKSLNNFKVAGSSLEASSKVYGLRVDCIHTDVLRMSAGLNAQTFSNKQTAGSGGGANGLDDDDDDDEVGAAADDPNSSVQLTGERGASGDGNAQKASKKAKRQRKAISTITKNKETLNARLDTVPLQDPVFGKLNSTVGSINSSNRLMNNILLTTESELRLRTNFLFWDDSVLPQCDYTQPSEEEEEETAKENAEREFATCDRLFRLEQYLERLQLRPTHGGYIISDTPEIIADDADKRGNNMVENDESGDAGGEVGGGFDENFIRPSEMSMAFDINAECEPLSPPAPILDIDYGDLEELTTEERTAINNCRGLRKQPVMIEDLRPVDASSKLEYSYRPLDKISQYWAGPSHWKFKRARQRGSTLYGQQQQQQAAVLGAGDGAERQNGRRRILNQRGKRAAAALAHQRTKQLNFGEYHDDLFIKLDDKYKARKANIQKKWDQRKLKLPSDLQLDSMMFYRYTFAPGLSVAQPELTQAASAMVLSNGGDLDDDTDDDQALLHPMHDDDGHFDNNEDDALLLPTSSANNVSVAALANSDEDAAVAAVGAGAAGEAGDVLNNTVLEIATSFEGAPSQVTKIIVPFAKRAKIIDMKNLKRCCTQLLTKQFKQPLSEQLELPKHPRLKDEAYAPGVASFRTMYNQLPQMLTQNMAEALSPSVAVYSVLHLANDLNLRLIPETDLEDFKIRQLML